jgi:hypothetical protein
MMERQSGISNPPSVSDADTDTFTSPQKNYTPRQIPYSNPDLIHYLQPGVNNQKKVVKNGPNE